MTELVAERTNVHDDALQVVYQSEYRHIGRLEALWRRITSSGNPGAIAIIEDLALSERDRLDPAKEGRWAIENGDAPVGKPRNISVNYGDL